MATITHSIKHVNTGVWLTSRDTAYRKSNEHLATNQNPDFNSGVLEVRLQVCVNIHHLGTLGHSQSEFRTETFCFLNALLLFYVKNIVDVLKHFPLLAFSFIRKLSVIIWLQRTSKCC